MKIGEYAPAVVELPRYQDREYDPRTMMTMKAR